MFVEITVLIAHCLDFELKPDDLIIKVEVPAEWANIDVGLWKGRSYSELQEALREIAEEPLTVIKGGVKEEITKRGIIELKERQETMVEITEHGKEALPNIQVMETVARLTPEQISSGEWRTGRDKLRF